jgi:hypothetical protein
MVRILIAVAAALMTSACASLDSGAGGSEAGKRERTVFPSPVLGALDAVRPAEHEPTNSTIQETDSAAA